MSEETHYLDAAAQQADVDATELAISNIGVPVDPDVAAHMGAFEEIALTPSDLDDDLPKNLKDALFTDYSTEAF